MQTIALGHHTSHRDAVFQVLVDIATLTKTTITTFSTSSVIIYTADYFVIPWCQTMDRHDNALACRAICNLVAEILFVHTNTTLSIRWIPGNSSFHPLKHLIEVASTVANKWTPAPLSPPTTIAALQAEAHTQSLKDWEQV